MTLRALEGAPLTDEKVARTVVATAHAIAERTGVTLASIDHDDASVTVTLDAGRLESVAFLAELRRLTNTWHAGRDPGGASLWGEPPEDDEPHGEPWR